MIEPPEVQKEIEIEQAEWDSPPTQAFRCQCARDGTALTGIYESVRSKLSGVIKSVVKIGDRRYAVRTTKDFRGTHGIRGTMTPL